MSITVAIVSYKYGPYVAQAIDSVQSQILKPDEIIVVDDGVGDGVAEIAEKMGVENIIKREKNLGVIDNFNDILFNQVKTDRMMMLGADNWLRPDYLKKMADHDKDIVSCDWWLTGNALHRARILNRCIQEDNGYWLRTFRMYHDKDKLKMIHRKNFIHGSSLYNVSKARSVGGYCAVPGISTLAEDWGLWRKMIEAGATHVHVPEPMLFYRRHWLNYHRVK